VLFWTDQLLHVNRQLFFITVLKLIAQKMWRVNGFTPVLTAARSLQIGLYARFGRNVHEGLLKYFCKVDNKIWCSCQVNKYSSAVFDFEPHCRAAMHPTGNSTVVHGCGCHLLDVSSCQECRHQSQSAVSHSTDYRPTKQSAICPVRICSNRIILKHLLREWQIPYVVVVVF